MNSKIFLIVFFLFSISIEAREIVDMSGKKVVVPNKIERVFGSAPPMTFMVSLFNPDLLVGLNFPAFNKNNFGDEKYNGKNFMNLPVLGGWQGSQKGANIEKLLKQKTQVIIAWNNDFLLEKVNKSLKNINLPTLMVAGDDIHKMPQSFKFLGSLLHMEDRGEELSRYAEENIKYIEEITSKIPKEKQVSFYYAQGPNGLQSDCSNSFHTTQFRFVNAKNIYQCAQKDIMGMESINFESILKANPEFIIVQSPKFYTEIFKNKKWAMLDAVKNKKVYLVPRIPFNWIDRPPSFMRLLGVHWLSSLFYPKYYTKNFKEEVKRFYKLFFHVNLSEKEFKEIIKRAL
jgi:iron complex transport system substrate-binding protein